MKKSVQILKNKMVLNFSLNRFIHFLLKKLKKKISKYSRLATNFELKK